MRNFDKYRMKSTGSVEESERIAVNVIAYLASRPEDLERFLSISGLTPATLRQSARSSGFHAAILDYILSDETLLVAFAAEQGFAPETILRARQVLAGPLYEADNP